MLSFSLKNKTTRRLGMIATLGLLVALHLTLTNCGFHRQVSQRMSRGSYEYGGGSGINLNNPVIILETDQQRTTDAIHHWLATNRLGYKVLNIDKGTNGSRYYERWTIRTDFMSTNKLFFDVTASRSKTGEP